MLIAFIIIQIVLLFFMALHDFVRVPPFNDLETMEHFDSLKKRFVSAVINTSVVIVPFVITLVLFPGPYPLWAGIVFVSLYGLMTVGTILAWWVPYFFGTSEAHRAAMSKFEATHHFLPPIKDHIVPNTLHVVLHLQVWALLVISVILLRSAV